MKHLLDKYSQESQKADDLLPEEKETEVKVVADTTSTGSESDVKPEARVDYKSGEGEVTTEESAEKRTKGKDTVAVELGEGTGKSDTIVSSESEGTTESDADKAPGVTTPEEEKDAEAPPVDIAEKDVFSSNARVYEIGNELEDVLKAKVSVEGFLNVLKQYPGEKGVAHAVSLGLENLDDELANTVAPAATEDEAVTQNVRNVEQVATNLKKGVEELSADYLTTLGESGQKVTGFTAGVTARIEQLVQRLDKCEYDARAVITLPADVIGALSIKDTFVGDKVSVLEDFQGWLAAFFEGYPTEVLATLKKVVGELVKDQSDEELSKALAGVANKLDMVTGVEKDGWTIGDETLGGIRATQAISPILSEGKSRADIVCALVQRLRVTVAYILKDTNPEDTRVYVPSQTQIKALLGALSEIVGTLNKMSANAAVKDIHEGFVALRDDLSDDSKTYAIVAHAFIDFIEPLQKASLHATKVASALLKVVDHFVAKTEEENVRFAQNDAGNTGLVESKEEANS